ncbi:MAG: hypothetical protein CFE44_08745 [Burkholderiales bacterium PBB4]|nr:MAG: hypothetical protein CFE44_08745 [Burkholderiales bacterium PBB4]
MSHYDTLEVSPRASAEVIRAAYKSLMQRHHPDKQAGAGHDPTLATRIAQAYGVLSDPVQRAAYDALLQSPQVATPSRQPGRPLAQRKSWQLWYAWGLIAIILVTGGVLLSQSKKRADPYLRPAPPLASQTTATPSLPLELGDKPVLPVIAGNTAVLPVIAAPETPQQVRARTVMPYALDLSVELRPERPGAPSHVLAIAELGLRIGTAEPQRWIQKIEAQRQDILRLILTQLSTARAEDLARPEADLYLKGLIANTVAQAIQLPTLAAGPAPTPTADATLALVQPIEVLLPQGCRVR